MIKLDAQFSVSYTIDTDEEAAKLAEEAKTWLPEVLAAAEESFRKKLVEQDLQLLYGATNFLKGKTDA